METFGYVTLILLEEFAEKLYICTHFFEAIC